MINGRHLIALGIVLSAGALAGCSASSSGGTPTPGTQSSAALPTVPATQSQPAATVDLSGTWSGQYSGPFTGTFTLTWTQSSGALNGTIMLSSPQDNLHINGTVSGSSISFGAVGVVTYTGTVSGNSMSGSYTDIANGQMGSWNATKS